MKSFHCSCGQRLFFESTDCVACGRVLGFDPESRQLLSFAPGKGPNLQSAHGGWFRHCRNRPDYGACNWLLPADGQPGYCAACRLNDVVPDLTRPGNLLLWQRLELAKRRLIYSLTGLRFTAMPRFRFLEDQQRNPDVADAVVVTGHADGVITINIAEADDASRHAVREQMFERYRTLLGHFRHECGHFVFPYLVSTPESLAGFRELFGDERAPYAEALQAYYEAGPSPDWQATRVSAYASAHPVEDWAESFAHYLHITDALETAAAFGMAGATAGSSADWISEWGQLSVMLNEMNRSLGIDDAYPFVIAAPVVRRLQFIHRLAGSAG
ncbi:MAG: putative zinc-binding metallopeptidase [Gammaproteobacteria bacterium]